jgi:hypothetical protein
MRSFARFALGIFCGVLAGCSGDHLTQPKPEPIPIDPPAAAIQRFVLAYEQKNAIKYQAMFTGDFTYEFSNAADPVLAQQFSTGWFKNDERESSLHLFSGYTPPGDSTLPAAATIDINLAVSLPTDDNSAGVNPATHKVLPTAVNGMISVPVPGGDVLTYAIENNFNVFYIVRGDVAVNLDSSQPADVQHWYIYRWVDLTGATAVRTAPSDGPVPTNPTTWGAIKARYR